MPRSPAPGNWKYILTWLASQTPLAAYLVLTKDQVPDNPGLAVGVSAAWMAVTAFLAKVWKEVEADAVKGAAKMLRAMPGATQDLAGRCRDRVAGWVTRWSPGFRRRCLEALNIEYGLFNDRGLGLINANRLDLDKVYVELKASTDTNLQRPNL